MERFGLRKWIMVAIKAPVYCLLSAFYFIGFGILLLVSIPLNFIVAIVMAIVHTVHRYKEGEDLVTVEDISNKVYSDKNVEATSTYVMKPVFKLTKWVYGIDKD